MILSRTVAPGCTSRVGVSEEHATFSHVGAGRFKKCEKSCQSAAFSDDTLSTTAKEHDQNRIERSSNAISALALMYGTQKWNQM